MAKGKKSKKASATRSSYRAWRGERNKNSHIDSENRRKQFYAERKKLMQEHNIGKSDGNRMVRTLQNAGLLPKDLIR